MQLDDANPAVWGSEQWILGAPSGYYAVRMRATPFFDRQLPVKPRALELGLLVGQPHPDGQGANEPTAPGYHRQMVDFVPTSTGRYCLALKSVREVFFDEDSIEPSNYVAAYDGEQLLGFGRMRPSYGGPDERFGYIFHAGELTFSLE